MGVKDLRIIFYSEAEENNLEENLLRISKQLEIPHPDTALIGK